MPEVSDVRNFLSNLSSQRVPDATIELQIQLANTMVEAEKSARATAEQIDDTKLAYASYLTMIAYSSEMERSTGAVPAPIITHLTVLEALYKQLLKIVKRGAPVYKPMNEQWDTILEQYQAGELDEAHDYY